MRYVIVIASVLLLGCQEGAVIQGPSPTVTTAPATVVECPNGGTDVDVNNKVTTICNGVDGGIGPVGPVGPPGNNATPVTVVQFCPNNKPVYPSVFPEVGLCLNGNLYGVYSQNDGFMAYLPPGLYESNAVGSQCTFTITANCGIIN